jgi:TetR/AcrR family transcriptional repressor of nem operon
MPARIEFDYPRAIDRATHLFWKRGYANASLRELLRVMGIGEGSFYNTFGSKKRLFLECLKHYNETISRRRLEALTSAPSLKAGIRAFFKSVLDDLDDPKTPSVCLLAGSLSREVLSQRELAPIVVGDMKTFGAAFQERMELAKKTGELPHDFDASAAAQVIVTFLLGLFRVIRVLQNRSEVERQVEMLLVGLRL